ncbi:MAG: hypothetical protein A3F11_00565 [Gammaproteobacteria bacterium RIFCSPHIGHO2_12_FULL_37_14]|nr:MAG: hypothetical protein A3F11_00565 [Gammaproteobacteria bacterium RIFCSPHIGHO2_12_FULL_37_14]
MSRESALLNVNGYHVMIQETNDDKTNLASDNTGTHGWKIKLAIGLTFIVSAAVIAIYFATRKLSGDSCENKLNGTLTFSSGEGDVFINLTNGTFNFGKEPQLTDLVGQLACNALTCSTASLFWSLMKPFINQTICIAYAASDKNGQFNASEQCMQLRNGNISVPGCSETPLPSCDIILGQVIQKMGEEACQNGATLAGPPHETIGSASEYVSANRTDACPLVNGSFFNEVNKSCFVYEKRWALKLIPDNATSSHSLISP